MKKSDQQGSIELEVKILGVDADKISQNLERQDAKKILDAVTYIEGFDYVVPGPISLNISGIPARFMPVFVEIQRISQGEETLIARQAYLRLRTEGERSELILKHRINPLTDEVKKEREVSIDIDASEWDEVRVILENAGLQRILVQEKKRISYLLPHQGIRFDIDTWPNVPTYVEIEADSEEKIKEGVLMLGYTQADTSSISGKELFEMYSVDPYNLVFKK